MLYNLVKQFLFIRTQRQVGFMLFDSKQRTENKLYSSADPRLVRDCLRFGYTLFSLCNCSATKAYDCLIRIGCTVLKPNIIQVFALERPINNHLAYVR